ncbi:heme oxygenase (biliverdin-producing) [Rathayibacter toxicus]|uniref:Heme oxygenase n=1 Tax=Rathayibacter toxicus TaxID=145458 RepID=A0A0C5BD02_9MICO|nr:biliverdin-producing heme oxygenase [Rathayibacter toxicus]AJM77046.1 heme oxygenase [Rathayibacter toxicus]ALS57143.1 heme oxygenase [Rathayibacter toxicus]KKM46047.1 heme oxygenase [Rathayibacter toxicus]PPG22982.1 biliverdin-producing heme oxygenase [Rathayibacter toxicus]PPG47563.1 biliverdin-producing heme oxygenase [Rathayibacter toxicus]
MTNVIPFSQALREHIGQSGADAEGAAFMTSLMTGFGSRDDYIALISQHYFVYEALEAVAATMAQDPIAAPFLSPKLTRLPAIAEDLRFLVGTDWRERISPLPSTTEYVKRIHTTAANWSGGFVAHHYTRYLGDLSGCAIVRTLLQRRFGFETNGVGFFLYGEIATPSAFRATYREQLDAADWDDEERERVIAEVAEAYRLTNALFRDLARSCAAA